MPVTIPFTFVGGPGNKAKASEVNADFQALAAKFSEGAGGIKDADISSSADINAQAKLSTTPGKQISTANLTAGCVDSTILKSDPAGAAGGVGSPAHIKNAVVTKDKLYHEVVQLFTNTPLATPLLTLAPGVSTEFRQNYDQSKWLFLDAVVDISPGFLFFGWTPVDVAVNAREYLQVNIHVNTASATSRWVVVNVKNVHPTKTMSFGAGASVLYTFIKNY